VLGDESVPGVADCIDDVVEGFEDVVESQLARKYCQMFSIGLGAGAREGSQIAVMFFGHDETDGGLVCQPARSNISTACAPTATLAEISSRCSYIASVSAQGNASVAPARQANCVEQIGPLVTLVGRLTRARSLSRPLPHEAVLLTDARLILNIRVPPSRVSEAIWDRHSTKSRGGFRIGDRRIRS